MSTFGGFSSRRRASPRKQERKPDVEEATGRGGGPTSLASAAKPPPSDRSEDVLLNRVSDDLTAKVRAWAHRVEAQYTGDEAAPSSLAVKILAATGLDHLGEPFWFAAVAGSVGETGSPSPLAEGLGPKEVPPAGTPSWRDEPLVIPVHDLTSDLLLFLCEADGTSATRACVGRVVLPLTDLLPLNPCAGSEVGARVWAEIFPPAPAYAAGSVHATYAPARHDLPGYGMERESSSARSAFPSAASSLSAAPSPIGGKRSRRS